MLQAEGFSDYRKECATIQKQIEQMNAAQMKSEGYGVKVGFDIGDYRAAIDVFKQNGTNVSLFVYRTIAPDLIISNQHL